MSQSRNIPMNQVAFAVLDLRRTEVWWREGLGFLPAGGNRALFRKPLSDGKIQSLPGSAMTCWCMVGRNDWAQLEFFQYETPLSKLMPADYRPCDLGYSRCGVWVADFDAALARLAALGTQPLAKPVGKRGGRRACVRNPDGVYVELMEDDPLPEQNARGRQDCPVALRSATLSTPDMQQSAAFLTAGLGMREIKQNLHNDKHEAIWGLAGAKCERRVFIDGSDNPSMLLELVQYHDPIGTPLPEDYRLCDQRILNICFGDPQGSQGVYHMHQQALAAGAEQTAPPLNIAVVGCVYVNDPLGFSYEFMWANPIAHKAFGFIPTGEDERPALDNQRVDCSVVVAAPIEEVFNRVGDHEGLSAWTGLGQFKLIQLGEVDAGGRGAVRSVSTPLGEIHEQITEWEPDRGYRYRIIQGSPFVGYWGQVELTAEGDGTRVDWTVRFRSKVPGLGGVLSHVVRSKLEHALTNLVKIFS